MQGGEKTGVLLRSFVGQVMWKVYACVLEVRFGMKPGIGKPVEIVTTEADGSGNSKGVPLFRIAVRL